MKKLYIALGVALLLVFAYLPFRYFTHQPQPEQVLNHESGGEPLLGAATSTVQYTPNIFPITDSLYHLGTTSRAWLSVTSDQFCLTADSCITEWGTGGPGGGASTTIAGLSPANGVFTLATGTMTGLNLNITTTSPRTITFTPQLQNGYVIPLQSTLDTFSTYAYGTSTYVNFGYASSTFPSFSYASSTFITSNLSSHVFTGTLPLANTFSATSTTVWIDGSRTDTYTADGSYQKPYKTISAALAGISGGASYAFHFAPGTYVEGAPVTFPSVPYTIHGNQATFIAPSGVTFPSSFDIYDLTIIGSVTQSEVSTSTVHSFNNWYISGTTTLHGLASFINGSTGTGSVITLKPTSFVSFSSNSLNNRIEAFGTLILTSASLTINDNVNYAITATTTGSVLYVDTSTITNTGTGGAINCANGATSNRNEIVSVKIFVNGVKDIDCGTAFTYLQNYNGINTANGTNIIPTGSNFVASTYAGISSIATSTFATTVGINTTTPSAILVVQGTTTLPTLPVLRVTSSSNATLLQVAANGSTTLSSLTAANCDVKSTTGGSLYCGVDATGGGTLSGGSKGVVAVWSAPDALTTGIIYDSGSVAGVNATSSTVTFNIQGAAGSGAAFNVASSTGTSMLYISPKGFIGIGTTSPRTGLELSTYGTSGGFDYQILFNPPAGIGPRFAFTSNGGANSVLLGDSSAGNGDFAVKTASDANWTTGTATWNDRLVVTNAGRAGVNTTTPAATLAVRGLAGAINPFIVASSTNAVLLRVEPNGSTTIASLSAADCDVKATTAGLLFCGADATSGSAGRSLTLTGSTMDADVELYTHTKSINIYASNGTVAATSTAAQFYFPLGVTITRVVCSTDTGSATIQLDERAEATPNTAGTDVMTSTLTCDSNSEATTSFSNAGIASRVPVNLDIDSVASSPTRVRIHVEYTIDD